MKNLIRFLAFVLMIGSACAQSNLPSCQGSDIARWNNCIGNYIYPNSDKYVGHWSNGKRSGKGTHFYLSNNQFKGNIFVGEWQDDNQNGQGTYTYANGNKYVGQFKDGKFNGQGNGTFAGGDRYLGEWINGKFHGQGTYTYANGDKYVGEWKDGRWNGQGTFIYANGDKYVGEWKDDSRHGQGSATFANGDKYDGEYKEGTFNGQGTFTFADGRRYVGELRGGSRNGLGTMFTSNGSVLSQGVWSDDKFVRSAPVQQVNAPTVQLSSNERDRLTAEVEAERKKRQELEAQLAASVQPIQPIQPQFNAPRRTAHALVIGNAAYPGSGRLDNPVNDANAISLKLRSMGFTVTTVTDANRQRLVQSMGQFRRTAASADISLLYYSGHGVQIFGTNYILPTDVDQTDLAQATIQGVSLNSVVENFLPGKTKLVFLDACRDNPLQRSSDRSISKGLAPISVSEGTLISYATKDGQTAADGTGKNSPFTQAVLEHINDPQDIAVVLRKVRERVMKITGGKQQPWEYGSLTGGELVLSTIKPR